VWPFAIKSLDTNALDRLLISIERKATPSDSTSQAHAKHTALDRDVLNINYSQIREQGHDLSDWVS
jgi:hypothetical protein